MKGILKIYHPDETIKYNIKKSFCKASYENQKNILEVELTTDDDFDSIEDDSLQYRCPQLTLSVSDFPIPNKNLSGKKFTVVDSDEDDYCAVDLYDAQEAFIYENELDFSTNEKGKLQLIWSGKIDDFFTNSEAQLPFKLKCYFDDKEDSDYDD